MFLFDNESINISKIHTVCMFESDKDFKHHPVKNYSTNIETYELVFFISGKRHTSFSNHEYDDLPNTVRYLPKGIFDGSYQVTTYEPGKCIDIFFDTTDALPHEPVILKNMIELKPLFFKIYDIWNLKPTGFYAKSMSILYNIIEKIIIHNFNYTSTEQTKRIALTYNYMMEHYTDKSFNYKKMCFRSGLSYDYFKNLFIKQYGMSPVKYVTALRIEKAKELLITGQYSMTQIADICGFENVYYFSTVFKKHTGVCPSKF